MTHILSGVQQMNSLDMIPSDEIVYKLSQLCDRMTYDQSVIERSKYPSWLFDIHLGQMKLLFSEMLFISKYQSMATDIIYVGAAGGYHIEHLSLLFPELRFHLWDASRFTVQETELIEINNRYFFNKDALHYKAISDSNPDIKYLFICDMRNVGVSDLSGGRRDRFVAEDIKKQMKWSQIIQPIAASLKMTFPYAPGSTEYLCGTTYLQPYGPFGTESRLIVTQYEKKARYDHEKNDELFAFFNQNIRLSQTYPEWTTYFEKYQIRNCWDNAYAALICLYYLEQRSELANKKPLNGIDDSNYTVDRYGAIELWMDIVREEQLEYHEKIDIVFDQDSLYVWPIERYDDDRKSYRYAINKNVRHRKDSHVKRSKMFRPVISDESDMGEGGEECYPTTAYVPNRKK